MFQCNKREKNIEEESIMLIFGRLLLPWVLGLIIIVSFSTTSKSSAEENIQPWQQTTRGGVSMRVLWTVSGYSLGINAVWGKEEACKLLFKPVDIDANSITFDGRKCVNVTFKKETVKAKEYLDNMFHTTPQTLGIEVESVEVIRTNCELPGFAEYLRLRDRRLVIHINGVFFYLEPAVNY